jgi:hypothetical protein
LAIRCFVILGATFFAFAATRRPVLRGLMAMPHNGPVMRAGQN